MSALSVPSSLLAMATVMPLVLPYGSQLAAMLYQAYSAGTIANPIATITAITLRVAWRTSRTNIFQISFIVRLPAQTDRTDRTVRCAQSAR